MKTRNEVVEKVANQKSIYKKADRYYVLKHTYDVSPRPVIIKSNLDSKTMDLLVAYLQFKVDELKHAYDFDQVDIADFLVKYFNCEALDQYNGTYFEIDLYENWEYWADLAADVEKIEHFQIDDLLNELKMLVSKPA